MDIERAIFIAKSCENFNSTKDLALTKLLGGYNHFKELFNIEQEKYNSCLVKNFLPFPQNKPEQDCLYLVKLINEDDIENFSLCVALYSDNHFFDQSTGDCVISEGFKIDSIAKINVI